MRMLASLETPRQLALTETSPAIKQPSNVCGSYSDISSDLPIMDETGRAMKTHSAEDVPARNWISTTLTVVLFWPVSKSERKALNTRYMMIVSTWPQTAILGRLWSLSLTTCWYISM